MSPNRALVTLAVAFACGILAADRLRVHPVLPLTALGMLGAMAVTWRPSRRPSDPCAPARHGFWLLVAASFLVGALRYAVVRWSGPGALTAYLGQHVELLGTVTDRIRQPAGHAVILRVDRIRPDRETWLLTRPEPVYILWEREPGSGGGQPSLEEGERIAVRGRLAVPRVGAPGGSERLRDRLGRQGVFLTLEAPSVPVGAGVGGLGPFRDGALALRRRLQATLQRALPPDRAALLAGLVLGVREGIPAPWEEAFRLTGVFHILAASGGNVALVAGPINWLLRRLDASGRTAGLATLPAIWGYCLIAGAEAPVLRASVAATLYYTGQVIGRRAEGYTSIAAALFAILIATPGALFDLGLQLSFLATLGILVFGRPLAAWLGRFLFPIVADPLATTLAASLAIEPLLLARFGYVSPISPLANLWVGFLVQAVVPAGAAAMSLGLVVPPAADWLLALVGSVLPLLVVPVEGLSLLHVSALELGPIAPGLLVIWYSGLGVMRWPGTVSGLWERLRWAAARLRALGSRPGGPVRVVAATGMVGALAGALALRLMGPVPARPDGVRVCLPNVGRGRAALFQLPDGKAIVVDGGPARPWTGEDAGRDAVLPLLRRMGIHRIDLAVLTTPRTDHAGGLATVLAALPVRELWTGPLPASPRTVRDVVAMARASGAAVVRVEEVAQWGHAPGLHLLARRSGGGSGGGAATLAVDLSWGRLLVRVVSQVDSGAAPRPPGIVELGPGGLVRLPPQAEGGWIRRAAAHSASRPTRAVPLPGFERSSLLFPGGGAGYWVRGERRTWRRLRAGSMRAAAMGSAASSRGETGAPAGRRHEAGPDRAGACGW